MAPHPTLRNKEQNTPHKSITNQNDGAATHSTTNHTRALTWKILIAGGSIMIIYTIVLSSQVANQPTANRSLFGSSSLINIQAIVL